MIPRVRRRREDEKGRWDKPGYDWVVVLDDEDYPEDGCGFPATLAQLRELRDALTEAILQHLRDDLDKAKAEEAKTR